ncbi:MAG: STAS domain-containing protein, partial [Thermoleophilia bacterium]|nr:STAS domain-containing protein [Thermoleophilia bacterium]
MPASGIEWARVGGEGHLVSAWGEVDLYVAPELRAALLGALAEEPEVLVVDLMPVTFIDSTALGALVAAARRAGPTRIAVACTNPE